MSNKKSKTAEAKNPPIAKVRIGLITASIWERETDKGTFHNVTFERRYRDKDGKWQSTDTYDFTDLLAKAKVADLAHTKILEIRNSEDE